jgi:hydrogenase maturation protease
VSATRDATREVLVLGYGNPDRRDDGLGPALAEAIGAVGVAGVETGRGFHLVLEDAARVAEHAAVVFADADVAGPGPFSFGPVEPADDGSFTSHTLSPEALLAIVARHFDRVPRAFLLGIRGYDFDGYGEGLSAGARANLDAAVAFLADLLRRGLPADGRSVPGGDQ